MTLSLRVANWNLAWRSPRSVAAPVIRRRLDAVGAEVAVLTEARLSMLDGWWHHTCDAGVGHYPGTPEDGTKVAIASTHPMRVFERCKDTNLPPGNFLAVDVTIGSRSLRIIGVVVRYNQINQYIDALPEALKMTVTDRTILAGDFNLRFPGGPASSRLVDVLDDFGLTIRTQGQHRPLSGERPLLDHIAVSESLNTSDLTVWPRRDPTFADGTKEVTDHAGSAITVQP